MGDYKNSRLLKGTKTALLIILILLLFTACDARSNETESTSTDNGSDKEVYELKYNSYISPSDFDWEPKMKSMEHLVERIEERTNDKVKIDLFYNNQLSGQAESLDALAKNTIQMQNISPGYWADKIPEGDFTSLPFWTMNEAHAFYIIRETEVGELYEQALEEYGVKPLMYWPSGITGFNSKEPIASPEDLKGLVYNNTSSLTEEYYKDFGAGLATIPIAEFYEAFLRGTLDAMVFPFSGIESLKLHEVIDYITLPATLDPAVGMVAISMETWDSLPSDLQEEITEVALELEQEAIEGSYQLTERAIDYAEEHDVEVINMTEENYNKFLEEAKEKVWKKFAETNDRTKKMVEILEVETEQWLEDNPDELEGFKAYFDD